MPTAHVPRLMRDESLLQMAWCAMLIVVVLAGAFGMQRYFDDWMFLLNAADAIDHGRVLAFVGSPVGQHWSPLWNAIEAINVRLAGWESDTLIRTLDAIILAGACVWFCRLASRLGCSPLAASVGVGVVALHHVNAAAVYSFDTYSQCFADLITWIVAGHVLAVVVTAGRSLRTNDGIWLMLLMTLGLLAKEQALATTASVLWLTAVALTDRNAAAHRRALTTLAIVTLAIATAFALSRRAAGVVFDASGPLRLCVGCAPRNIVVLLGLLLLPVRSLMVMDAWRATPMDTGRLIAATVATMAVGTFLLGAMTRARRTGEWRRLVAIVGLVFAACLPTSLLGHVGELYAHTAVFWFALLCADAVDGWRTGARWVSWHTVAVVGYLVSLGTGLRANLADMRENGRRATSWLAAYAQAVERVPDGAVVLVHGARPQKADGDYSLYRLTTPEYLMLELPPVLEHRVGDRIRIFVEWAADAADRHPDRDYPPGGTYDLWRRGDRIVIERR
jgi:hypothetical protein